MGWARDWRRTQVAEVSWGTGNRWRRAVRAVVRVAAAAPQANLPAAVHAELPHQRDLNP